MKLVLALAAIGGIGAVVAANLPEVKRYLNVRKM
jgi:hypothetical protein